MLKKVLLTGCILGLTFTGHGEVSLGVNLESNLSTLHNQVNSNNENHSTTYRFGIQPQVLILAADFIEIAPFAGFNSYRYVRYVNEDQTSESSSFGFNLGCGLYFRVAGNNVLRFSIGPEVFYGMNFVGDSDTYSLSTGLYAPANIDLSFSPHFFVRLSPNLVEVPFSYTYQDENAYTNSFSFRIITQTSTALGFFFTF